MNDYYKDVSINVCSFLERWKDDGKTEAATKNKCVVSVGRTDLGSLKLFLCVKGKEETCYVADKVIWWLDLFSWRLTTWLLIQIEAESKDISCACSSLEYFHGVIKLVCCVLFTLVRITRKGTVKCNLKQCLGNFSCFCVK